LRLAPARRIRLGSVNVPDELRYTPDHVWVRVADGGVQVGITDYAQDALGDIVFVQLPEPGTQAEAGASLGEVESTKSVSDIYCPLAGTVVEVNGELTDTPERLNEDPYGEGWLCVIQPAEPAARDRLLDAEASRKLIES
jgi:glycine cleavage system H protein